MTKRKRRRYTKAELGQLVKGDMRLPDLAKVLGKSEDAVRKQLGRNGVLPVYRRESVIKALQDTVANMHVGKSAKEFPVPDHERGKS